jgi:coniferyl-aldehyde dehydrogenase
MATTVDTVVADGAIGRLTRLFDLQKAALRSDPAPSFDERCAHIRALAAGVMRHRRRIKDALHADFVWHPEGVADLIEILGIAARAEYVIGELPRWMSADQRSIDPALWGSAQASVHYQPKGVIGNMVPWNFPFDIAFGPLIEMLAAGNRAILKPSDLGPASAELIAEIVEESFDEARVAVVIGGLELAQVFPTLAWDHLMFTGSPTVGRQVMSAAARNLVPVTLELGGKCPAIVSEDAVNTATVANIVGMKLLKSGQVCVAPDHVYVPRNLLDRFVTLVDEPRRGGAAQYTARVPIRPASSLSAILTDLCRLINEARKAGSVIVQPERQRRPIARNAGLPLTLIVDPNPDLRVMTEEIFGPLLPIVPYDTLDDVISHINAGERPLALYVYARDRCVQLIKRCRERRAAASALISPPSWRHRRPAVRWHRQQRYGPSSRDRGIPRIFQSARRLVRGVGGAIDAFNPPYRTLDGIVAQSFGPGSAASEKSV